MIKKIVQYFKSKKEDNRRNRSIVIKNDAIRIERSLDELLTFKDVRQGALDSDDANAYTRLLLASHFLQEVGESLSYLYENLDTLDIYTIDALWSYSIIKYCVPFNSVSKKLYQNLEANFSDKNIAMHFHLKSLRDKEMAHFDPNPREEVNLRISENEGVPYIESVFLSGPGRHELQPFMIVDVISHVSEVLALLNVEIGIYYKRVLALHKSV